MGYILITSIVVIFILLYYYFKYTKYDAYVYKLRGPTPYPVIGNLHQIGTKSPHLKLTELSIQYNHIYRMWFGDQYTVIVSDPKLIKAMFVDKFTIFMDRPYTAKLAFGNQYHGTTTGCGDYWAVNRGVVSRALRNSANMPIHGFINKKVHDFMEMIEEKFDQSNMSGADGNEFIILEKPRFHIQRFTISIMYKFIFNEDIPYSNENDQDSKELQVFFKTIKDIFKMYSASTLIDFISFLQPFYFKYLKMTDTLFPTIFNFIDNKYQEHLRQINFNINDNKKKEEDENENEDIGAASGINGITYISNKDKIKPKDFMESLIYEYGKNNPNQSEIQSILSTSLDFFLAGSETSSTAIEWTILKLINRPDYQEDIYKELCRLRKCVIIAQDRELTPLLNSFIKETLRLHPPAPFGLPHYCARNSSIDEKYFIPKGAHILINYKAVALNDNVFNNAKEFIGDRFVRFKEEKEGFITFGVGFRNCIGSSIAMDEIYLFISNLILRYQISSIDGQPIDETEKVRLNLINKKFNFKISKRCLNK